MARADWAKLPTTANQDPTPTQGTDRPGQSETARKEEPSDDDVACVSPSVDEFLGELPMPKYRLVKHSFPESPKKPSRLFASSARVPQLLRDPHQIQLPTHSPNFGESDSGDGDAPTVSEH